MLQSHTITGPATMLHKVTTPNISLTSGIVATLATMLMAKAAQTPCANLLPARCNQPQREFRRSNLSVSYLALSHSDICLTLHHVSGKPHSIIAATEINESLNPASYNHLPSHNSISAATPANLLRGSPPLLALIANCNNVNISAARTIEGVAPAIAA